MFCSTKKERGRLDLVWSSKNRKANRLDFIKIAPENPVLWTGMKGVSAKGRKKH